MGHGANCRCVHGRGDTQIKPFEPGSHSIFKTAEQPDGWHPCLKQKTRCVVKVVDGSFNFYDGNMVIKEFTAFNSCHVEDALDCPRVAQGSKSGEGYELCGPPNHAEQEAAKLVLQEFPKGAPEGSTAFLYGHTYLCQPCQEALVDAGIRHHVITGEPA